MRAECNRCSRTLPLVSRNSKHESRFNDKIARMALDAATLHELKLLDEAGGGGLIAELVEMFATGTPERIARLRAAAQSGKAADVAQEAHALKGSAGALGAVSLLTLVGQLEAKAKAGDLAHASQQLDAIEVEFRSSLAELELEKPRT